MSEKLNHVVIKPWGREYLTYRNSEVAIWVLEIKKGEATSLHCHPSKNTALVVLQGEIELSFIRDETPRRLSGLSKINIFRGRFHRTRATSENVVLLEVEAPDDKRNIVRLEDDYGRAASPLEEATEPLDSRCLQIVEYDHLKQFAGCSLSIIRPSAHSEILQEKGQHIYITLGGGLKHGLVPAGDAIDGETLARFTRTFKPIWGASFLHIWRM